VKVRWAESQGNRVEATPNQKASCPCCGGEVLAKCGEVVTWHWAHKSRDCDPWSEPESEWHREWKSLFPREMQEVVIGPHRADVLSPRGVIELQHSSISAAEIRKREQFYEKMVWVIDAQNFTMPPDYDYAYEIWEEQEGWKPEYKKKDQGNLLDLLAGPSMDFERQRQWVDKWLLQNPHVRWLWPRKSWMNSMKTLVFDRGGDELFVTSSEQIGWFGDYTQVEFRRMNRARFVELCMKSAA
jgi:hypothetical protein